MNTQLNELVDGILDAAQRATARRGETADALDAHAENARRLHAATAHIRSLTERGGPR
jgi:hypothetical protein